MAQTTFTGPVRSINGFITGADTPGGPNVVGPGIVFTATPTASLPAPTVALKGAVMCVSDNGAGNNEVALVVCNGVAWTLCDGTALS